MRPQPFDEHNGPPIIHCGYKTVGVSFDVENNSPSTTEGSRDRYRPLGRSQPKLTVSPNQMQRLRSVDNGICNQALVEGGQLAAVCAGECQKVAVCHLR